MAIGSQAGILEEANGTQWKELVGTARCLRCKGFMVVEHCFDLLNSDGHLGFQTRRCVQCGELVDPIILRNRELQLLSGLGKSRRGLKSCDVEISP